MYILKEWCIRNMSDWEIEEVVAASDNKERLIEKAGPRNIVLDEEVVGHLDFEMYCKKIGKDYYRQRVFYSIEKIDLI